MKYYLIAGEASGDLHGANLIKALSEVDAEADFRFFGGDKMQAQGGKLVKHYAEMAFMGIVEVMKNLGIIRRNMKQAEADLMSWKPDVLVLIDFPGFNLRIADFAHKKGLKVCYYISPKIWAWNQKRVHKIKKVVDRMLCILPFEVDFYERFGMKVDYVGNPLLDEISTFKPDTDFTAKKRVTKPMVALLPGSRKQEIELLLPAMLSVMPSFPNTQFVIAGAPLFDENFYRSFAPDIPIVFNQTYNLLTVADAALVTSGTATLETALFNVPQVVLYKGHPIFIWVARIVTKIRFISLVNLIADKKIVTELIQEDCNTENITVALKDILSENGSTKMKKYYADLHRLMGKPGASKRAAHVIMETAALYKR